MTDKIIVNELNTFSKQHIKNNSFKLSSTNRYERETLHIIKNDVRKISYILK